MHRPFEEEVEFDGASERGILVGILEVSFVETDDSIVVASFQTVRASHFADSEAFDGLASGGDALEPYRPCCGWQGRIGHGLFDSRNPVAPTALVDCTVVHKVHSADDVEVSCPVT